jgi:hypothetical protein
MPKKATPKPNERTKGILVSREEFLKAKPVRNPGSTWEKDEEGLHVRVPRKRTLLLRLASKLFPISQENRVLLDEQGAFIWDLCDGEHQIGEIARKLSEKHNMRVPDAEAALDLYFVHLSRSGLVGFALPEPARKRYHKRFDNSEKTVEKIHIIALFVLSLNTRIGLRSISMIIS